MSSRKILDINENGKHIVCIKTDSKCNPYRIYDLYLENGSQHRKLLEKYDDFDSTMLHVTYLMSDSFRQMYNKLYA